ncbi:MAG: cyclic peptide export ABC transporter, partial [Acidobacteriota bacterium]|nr:cyclic peptide export ABC transporter [Acidobacteriota bacterium]
MRDLFQLIVFLLRLSRGIRFSRLAMVGVAVGGVIGGLANTGMIALINNMIDRGGKPTAQLVWTFAGLCLILPVVRFLSQVLLIDLSQNSLLTLRVQLTRSVLAAPLRQLETIGAPKLLATLTNDIGVIVDSLGMIPTLFMDLAIVVSYLVYLGMLSWTVLLEVTGFIVLGTLSYQLPVHHAMGYFVRARERFNEVVGQIRALTEGAKELKMHRGRRGAFLDAVVGSTKRLQHENRAGAIIFAAAGSWGQVLFFMVIGFLVLGLPQFQPIANKTLIGYVIILSQMMVPIEVLVNSFPAFSRAAVSARNVEQLGLSLEVETPVPEAAPAAPAGWERLELAGVTHGYRRENEEESFQLGPIDLSFRPGELVFIVGGNGSGKTTLAKLLIGLYVPESGEVRLDGRPVTNASREEFRERFAVVFSDFFVFEKLLGLEAGALDEQATRYLTRLHLEKKVKVEDGVLSTVDLSQGQRKRLALLTAYLEDRAIYLFDEWAADQDPTFKEIFYLELLPELKARGKTVFVISHDDRYFHVADRVLKLDYGRIDSDRSAADFLEQTLGKFTA